MRPVLVVFGGDGRLGRAIAAHPGAAFFDVQTVSRAQCDAADARAASALLAATAATHSSTAVVNAAAFTDVGRAEKLRRTGVGRAIVLRANVTAPAVLARVAQQVGAVFLHVSTDYVFSGGGTKAHKLEDRPKPQGFYGRTKYMGERAVERTLCSTTTPWGILRIGWLHGAEGDFVEKVLSAALSGRLHVMRSNQRGVPTSYEAAAAAVIDAAVALMKPGAVPLGICHYAEKGAVTNRFRLTQRILAAAQSYAANRAATAVDAAERERWCRVGGRFALASLTLRGIREHDRARPANCVLGCGQLRFGILSAEYFWEISVDKSVEKFFDRTPL